MRIAMKSVCFTSALLISFGLAARAQRPRFSSPAGGGFAGSARSFARMPLIHSRMPAARLPGSLSRPGWAQGAARPPRAGFGGLRLGTLHHHVIIFPPEWLYSGPFGYLSGLSPYGYPGFGYGAYPGYGGYDDYPSGESRTHRDYRGPNYKSYLNSATPAPPSVADTRSNPASVVTSLDGRVQPAGEERALVISSGLHTLVISKSR